MAALNWHLRIASAKGDVSEFHRLVGLGADINGADKVRNTPLIVACDNDQITIVDALIKAGADLNFDTDLGFTALIRAAMSNRVLISEALIRAGADLDKTDKDGKTALDWAKERNHKEIEQLIVRSLEETRRSSDPDVATASTTASTSAYVPTPTSQSVSSSKSPSSSKVTVSNLHLLSSNIIPHHPHRLYKLECSYPGGCYTCDFCKQPGTGDVFNCAICNYDVHPLCISTALFPKDFFIEAAENGDVAEVSRLIGHGAKIDLIDRSRCTALSYASQYGHLDVVKTLIKFGANVDHVDSTGNTPLIRAIAPNGHIDVAKVLIEAGANLEIEDRNGRTALNCCQVSNARGNQKEIEQLIISAMKVEKKVAPAPAPLASSSAVSTSSPITTTTMNNVLTEASIVALNEQLVDAAYQGKFSDFHRLVGLGGDINSSANDGSTVLMRACEYGHIEIVKSLLELNVNINTVNKIGQTALMRSSVAGRIEIVHYLLEAKADPNIQDRAGWTALMWCIVVGKFEVAKALVNAKANLSLKNVAMQTALVLARNGGHVAIEALLVSAVEANTTTVDSADQPLISLYPLNADKVTAVFSADMNDGGFVSSSNSSSLNNEAHVTDDFQIDYQAYLDMISQRSKQPFNHSRICMVGKGGAGKTSLSMSIRGKPPTKVVHSTIGFESSVCEIYNTSVVSKGDFRDFDSDKYSESERAVARAIKREERSASASASAASATEGDVKVAKSSTSSSKIIKSSGTAVKSIYDDQHTPVSDADCSIIGSSSHINRDSSNTISSDSGGGDGRVKVATTPKSSRSSISPPRIDTESVAKCLSDNIQTNSKCTVALYDFGGQEVFDVLHAFYMTRFSVYILVFDMNELLSQDEATSKKCLATIKFWLDTIAMHTLSEIDSDLTLPASKGRGGDSSKNNNAKAKVLRTAPVALVGTRKDEISDPKDHSFASTMLYNAFCEHVVFKSSLLQNEAAVGMRKTVLMYFFTVNNLIGRDDPTVMALLGAIEEEIDSSDYVHQERPISWLQSYDYLKATKRPYFPLGEVEEVTRSFRVDDAEVPELLSFLHDMGMLMWHEVESLRNIVIMDPASFFIYPATNIICKHEPTFDDDTVHFRDVHKDAAVRFGMDFTNMKKKGVVTEPLMLSLLSECGENLQVVLTLLLKYGLVSQILTKIDDVIDFESVFTLESNSKLFKKHGSGITEVSRSYIVPSLLPTRFAGYNWPNTFYYFFTTSLDSFRAIKTMSWDDVKTSGFLPSSLFQRLVCRAITWSQSTLDTASETIRVSELFKDVAVLKYGRQRFQLRHLKEENCIQVDIEGDYPVAVYKCLLSQLRKLVKECMPSLRCIPTLLFNVGSSSSSSSASTQLQCHVSIDDAAKIAKHVDYSIDFSGSAISHSDMQVQHHRWVRDIGILPCYDVFISHRHPNERNKSNVTGVQENRMLETIYDQLTNYSIGSRNRSIDTFLDTRRIPPAEDFERNFASALTKSKLIVPVISRHSLEKMTDGTFKGYPYFSGFDSDANDSVLVEWIMALELRDANANANRDGGWGKHEIYPILLGSLTDERAFDIFNESDSVTRHLSRAIPHACISKAKQLLVANGMSFNQERIDTYTVKGVYDALVKINGCLAWEIEPFDNMALEISRNLRDLVAKHDFDLISQSSHQRHLLSEGGRGGTGLRGGDCSPRFADGSSTPITPSSTPSTPSTPSNIPNWEAAFLLLAAKNATKGCEEELVALIEEIGLESSADMSDTSISRLQQLADMLKEIKSKQFLRACGL